MVEFKVGIKNASNIHMLYLVVSVKHISGQVFFVLKFTSNLMREYVTY